MYVKEKHISVALVVSDIATTGYQINAFDHQWHTPMELRTKLSARLPKVVQLPLNPDSTTSGGRLFVASSVVTQIP